MKRIWLGTLLAVCLGACVSRPVLRAETQSLMTNPEIQVTDELSTQHYSNGETDYCKSSAQGA